MLKDKHGAELRRGDKVLLDEYETGCLEIGRIDWYSFMPTPATKVTIEIIGDDVPHEGRYVFTHPSKVTKLDSPEGILRLLNM